MVLCDRLWELIVRLTTNLAKNFLVDFATTRLNLPAFFQTLPDPHWKSWGLNVEELEEKSRSKVSGDGLKPKSSYF